MKKFKLLNGLSFYCNNLWRLKTFLLWRLNQVVLRKLEKSPLVLPEQNQLHQIELPHVHYNCENVEFFPQTLPRLEEHFTPYIEPLRSSTAEAAELYSQVV